jgi:hypothetical protein
MLTVMVSVKRQAKLPDLSRSTGTPDRPCQSTAGPADTDRGISRRLSRVSGASRVGQSAGAIHRFIPGVGAEVWQYGELPPKKGRAARKAARVVPPSSHEGICALFTQYLLESLLG